MNFSKIIRAICYAKIVRQAIRAVKAMSKKKTNAQPFDFAKAIANDNSNQSSKLQALAQDILKERNKVIESMPWKDDR